MKSFKTRFRVLLVFCVICLIMLSLLQLYLIKNYFQLTKKNFIEDTKIELKQININFPGKIDDDEAFLKRIKENYALYKNGVIDKPTLLRTFKADYDSINQTNAKNLELLKNRQFQDIQYKYEFTRVTISIDGKLDSLIQSKDKPFLFYGEQFSDESSHSMGKGSWIIDSEIKDEKTKKETQIVLSFSYQQLFSIHNWQQKVFLKMIGVLTGSGFIFLAVCVLFFFTFKSLLKQKKQNEITQDFANNITHELKTPIAAISLIGKSLQQSLSDTNKQTTLNLFDRQVHKLNKIVDRTLESVQLENFKPKLETINASLFLNEYCASVILENHQFKFEIKGDSMIQINTDSLTSVLDNLIENATKYSEKGTQICLKSTVKNNTFIIEVLDQGVGIPKEHRTHIFERYFRVIDGNIHKIKGLGLGLYLSKTAIEQMNGTLSYHTNEPKGSIFRIKIPTV